MKRFTQICLLMTALCLALTVHAQEKSRPKVVVLPFQNKADNPWLKSEAGNAWWWHGGAEAMQDVFVTELVKKNKRINVMNRKALEAAAATQQLTLSGDVDPVTAMKLGKLLGVNYLLTGAVTEYGVTEKSSASRKNLAMTLQAKLIDTSTGEIVWTDQVRHVEQVSVGGFGGGVDDERIFKKAARPCVKRLIAKWRASKFFDIFVGDE